MLQKAFKDDYLPKTTVFERYKNLNMVENYHEHIA